MLPFSDRRTRECSVSNCDPQFLLSVSNWSLNAQIHTGKSLLNKRTGRGQQYELSHSLSRGSEAIPNGKGFALQADSSRESKTIPTPCFV